MPETRHGHGGPDGEAGNSVVCAVGIDIVDVAEIEASVARFGGRYLRRIYTPEELDSCGAGTDGRRLAGLFAAKEATLKVLAPDDEAIDWRCIEVLARPGGGPLVALSGAGAALAAERGIVRLSGSIHAGRERATAVVIAEGNRAG